MTEDSIKALYQAFNRFRRALYNAFPELRQDELRADIMRICAGNRRRQQRRRR